MNHSTLNVLLSLMLGAMTCSAALAQHHHDAHGGAASAPTGNYAGQQAREIKALSTQEEQDWLEGKGLGLAKAAELNGYPGPMHTLEHAVALQLSAAQQAQSQALLERHKATARALGKELVDAERALDQAFAQQQITPAQLGALNAQIGQIHSMIRNEHLRTHLEQTALLSSTQIARYQVLRGYKN